MRRVVIKLLRFRMAVEEALVGFARLCLQLYQVTSKGRWITMDKQAAGNFSLVSILGAGVPGIRSFSLERDVEQSGWRCRACACSPASHAPVSLLCWLAPAR